MSGTHLLPMWNCTQNFPILGIRNKTVWAWLPKSDKQACGWSGTKSSPTKRRFLRAMPIKGIVRFWWQSLRHVRSHGFVTPKGMPPYYRQHALAVFETCSRTRVVVVHSCLCQALIKHKWDASFADMGLHSKSSHTWY